jgi:hypothetical protein
MRFHAKVRWSSALAWVRKLGLVVENLTNVYPDGNKDRKKSWFQTQSIKRLYIYLVNASEKPY